MATNSYTPMERRKVLSILGQHLELVGIAAAKLFTSGKDGKKWIYSELQGLLCLVLDYKQKTRYLVLFDSHSFEKLFRFELYVDFHKNYHVLSEDFHCFEITAGFFGIKYFNTNEAQLLKVIISKFNDDLVKTLFENRAKLCTSAAVYKTNLLKKSKEYCDILREKFSSKSGQYDETYMEDGLEIVKARNFEMFNNISFDREKKEFVFGEISEELKDLFRAAGIKKKHLKDMKLAMTLFKDILLGLNAEEEKKSSKKEIVVQGWSTDSQSTEGSEKVGEDNLKKSLEFRKSQSVPIVSSNIPSVPTVPNVPTIPTVPSVPNVPKVPSIPSVPKPPPLLLKTNLPPVSENNNVTITSSTDASTDTREQELNQIKLKPVSTQTKSNNLQDEMKNVVLKPVSKDTSNTVPTSKFAKNVKDTNYLQQSLADAIKQRRIDLTKNDVESDSDDDDWD